MFNKLNFRNGVIVLVILHIVGALGFNLLEGIWLEWLILLTPFNLWISLGLLLWYEQEIQKKFWFGVAGIFGIGFLIEALGVATGWPFGIYAYGRTLGAKWLEVPWVIGANWVMLTLASTSTVRRFTSNRAVIVPAAALLMTLLDILIEPVAMKLDFWNWEGNEIPLSNYISWFVVALLTCLVRVSTSRESMNRIGIWLIVVQALFFAVLNFN
jgi:putative membrane protein